MSPQLTGKIGRPDSCAKLDDAEAGDTRDLRHIGGQRHVPALASDIQHAYESGDSALDLEAPAMVARAAHGADAEPFGGDRVDFAVAVPRDQNLEAVLPRKNGSRKCWPCHIAIITGSSDSYMPIGSGGSMVKRLVFHTSRRYSAAARRSSSAPKADFLAVAATPSTRIPGQVAVGAIRWPSRA